MISTLDWLMGLDGDVCCVCIILRERVWSRETSPEIIPLSSNKLFKKHQLCKLNSRCQIKGRIKMTVYKWGIFLINLGQ